MRDEFSKEFVEYFTNGNIIFTSRATTGIYLALKALGFSHGKVVLPSIACPAPAYAIVCAGLEPVFCDVNIDDFTISSESLRMVLEQESDVRAIMPVHLYGYPYNVPEIHEIARRYGIFIIEDAAQAMGGKFDGRYLGFWGDAGVYSFGYSKIVDLKGGGAITAKDRDLIKEIRKIKKKLPPKIHNHDVIEKQRIRMYYLLDEFRVNNPAVDDFFLFFPHVFKPLFIHESDEIGMEKVRTALSGLKRKIEKRRAIASFYDENLKHPLIHRPKVQWEDAAVWRYSFLLMREDRGVILNKIRSEGFDISSWYPMLNNWFSSGKKQDISMKNSKAVEKHIVNLWVNEDLNLKTVRFLIELLNKLIDK